MDFTVNADDFGWNQSCTSAIMEAFDKKFIMTTTMMGNGAYFEEAASLIQNTPYAEFVGIHFDLTEGKPLTEGMRSDPFFCDGDGNFHGAFDRYTRLTSEQRTHAYGELKAQAERIQKAGLRFHHADSHHHIHTAPFITPIVRELMREYGIEKMRIHRNIGNIGAVKRIMKAGFNFMIQSSRYTDYFGSFEDTLEDHRIPMAKGTLEIMCHPDLTIDGILVDRRGDSTYEEPAGTPMAELRQLLDRKMTR